MGAVVISVARDHLHRFAKAPCAAIELLAGLGIAGDAHCGATVRHRSRLARPPQAPNLRQVHLLHAELFAELGGAGFVVHPGEMGENIATRGLALLSLPRGTRLRIGPGALLELTGLRNPCRQIDDHIGAGATAATLARGADGQLIRKAGVMAIVLEGGTVRPGDAVEIAHCPAGAPPLEPV